MPTVQTINPENGTDPIIIDIQNNSENDLENKDNLAISKLPIMSYEYQLEDAKNRYKRAEEQARENLSEIRMPHNVRLENGMPVPILDGVEQPIVQSMNTTDTMTIQNGYIVIGKAKIKSSIPIIENPSKKTKIPKSILWSRQIQTPKKSNLFITQLGKNEVIIKKVTDAYGNKAKTTELIEEISKGLKSKAAAILKQKNSVTISVDDQEIAQIIKGKEVEAAAKEKEGQILYSAQKKELRIMGKTAVVYLKVPEEFRRELGYTISKINGNIPIDSSDRTIINLVLAHIAEYYKN